MDRSEGIAASVEHPQDGSKKSTSLTPYRACSRFVQARIVTVEPVIFFFMFAQYLRIPLYEQYYYVSHGTDLLKNTSFPFPNGSFCLNSSDVDEYAGNGTYKLVETWSDNLVVYGEVASHVPAIVITVLLGPLSDRFGRKPLLVAAGLGALLEGILSILILHFRWSPYYFIPTYFVGGAFGGFTAVLAASFSYIADVSSDKWRGFRIGVLEAAYSLGIAFSEFSAGFWLQWNHCDFMQPMWLFVACNIVLILYVIFCIPESLTKKQRNEVASKTSKGFSSLVRGIKIFTCLVPQYAVWKLWAATFVASLMVFNTTGNLYITVYFLKAPPFDLNALMIGVYQCTAAISKAVSNTLLMGVFSALRMPEAAIATIAILVSSGCNVLIGFSKRLWQLLAVVSFQGIETISWTALRTLMSKLVAPEDTGSMFGILAATESLFALISTVAWPNLYNLSIDNNLSPGTVYKIMAAVALVNLPPLIALLVSRKTRKNTTTPTSSHQTEIDSEKESLLHSAGSQTPHEYDNHGTSVNNYS